MNDIDCRVVGQRIHDLRISRGLTLKFVVISIGTITERELRQVERGTLRLDLEQAISLALFYDVPIDYLVDKRLSKHPIPASAREDVFSRTLDEDDQQELEEYITFLKDKQNLPRIKGIRSAG